MRLIVNLLLLALVAFMAFLLIQSIREPINFKTEKDTRENAVIDKLILIRTMQEFYRDITFGSFAPTWDTLKYVLETGNFRSVKVVGDPDDPRFTGVVLYDTTYVPAIDTIRALGINLDSLQYVPYGEGTTFKLTADTLTYQKTMVNVVEVSVPITEFMGPFADPRFAKYDDSYDPNKLLKFGDMTKPNLAGNWER